MMKSAFVDDQKDVDLSQSCNLGQEIMFFMLYAAAALLLVVRVTENLCLRSAHLKKNT